MLCVLGWCSGLAAAEERGAWGALSLTGAFRHDGQTTRWRWSVDAQYRFLDTDSNFRQVLFSPALGYAVNNQLTLWAGYTYANTDTSITGSIDESRLFQDLNWKTEGWGWLRINLRSRMEQRWVDGASDVGWRFRQLAKFEWPISANDRLSLIVSDEILISLNDTDWGEQSGFNQNRFFLGFGYRFTDKVSGQIGYLNQYIDRTAIGDLTNNLLLARLRLNF